MRALSSRGWFWVAQSGGWPRASSLFLTFLPAWSRDAAGGAPQQGAPRHRRDRVESGLLQLYRRITPEPEVTGRVAAIALVASCWQDRRIFRARRDHGGRRAQPSFAIFLDPTTAPRSILEFVFAFLVWSAAYFWVLIWRRSQEREREATEARRLAQEAQLQMLAYQLNPHFLFNALTSIRAMIDEDRARARQMVTELAAFLRHALVERAFVTTTLAAELDALRGYLAIEQIRFEERLAIETHVDAAAEACAIPAFLIHPLLENAIKHGARETGPRVKLDARVTGDMLRVEVWNTGALASRTPNDQRRGPSSASWRPHLTRPGRDRRAQRPRAAGALFPGGTGSAYGRARWVRARGAAGAGRAAVGRLTPRWSIPTPVPPASACSAGIQNPGVERMSGMLRIR